LSDAISTVDANVEIQCAFYSTNIDFEGMIDGYLTGHLGMGKYGYRDFYNMLWSHPRYCQRGYLFITTEGIVFLGTIRRFDLPIPEPIDCKIRKTVGWKNIMDMRALGSYLRIIFVKEGKAEILYLKETKKEEKFYLDGTLRKMGVTPNQLLERITECMNEP
jgi:hypothetical protein